MSVKDKILVLLMILILIGGAYVYYTYTQVMDRMDLIDKQQYTHIDEVNKEFRDGLTKLDLQFIGRGKHLQTAQGNIVSNKNLINNVNENLTGKIEDVSYDIDEVVRNVGNDISKVDQALEDLRADVDSERRRATRRLTDIEQSITNVRNDLKAFEGLEVIRKAKAKKKK